MLLCCTFALKVLTDALKRLPVAARFLAKPGSLVRSVSTILLGRSSSSSSGGGGGSGSNPAASAAGGLLSWLMGGDGESYAASTAKRIVQDVNRGGTPSHVVTANELVDEMNNFEKMSASSRVLVCGFIDHDPATAAEKSYAAKMARPVSSSSFSSSSSSSAAAAAAKRTASQGWLRN